MQTIQLSLNEEKDDFSALELKIGELGIVTEHTTHPTSELVGQVVIRIPGQLLFPETHDIRSTLELFRVRRLRRGETVTFSNT